MRPTPLLLLLALTLLLALPCAAQSATVLRLSPGQDLRQELLRLAREQQWEAASVVTCVGSLRQAHLRWADAREGSWRHEKFEIVSLVGTFDQRGGHFHVSLGDSQGQTWGGHLLDGCLVYTTAEIVILPLPHYRFLRVLDPETGYPELQPTRLP